MCLSSFNPSAHSSWIGGRFRAVVIGALIGGLTQTSAAVEIQEIAKLNHPNPSELPEGFQDVFGEGLNVTGDTLFVGVPGDDVGVRDAGSVQIFERDPIDRDKWLHVAELSPPSPNPDSYFGLEISVSDDHLLVASLGAAYIYQRQNQDNARWVLKKKLIGSDTQAGDVFAHVGLADDFAVVGARGARVGGIPRSGAAYVFERNQGGEDQWGEVAKLVVQNPTIDLAFGSSVAVSGDTIAVGAKGFSSEGTSESGAAYIFVREFEALGSWTQTARITPPIATVQSGFGWAVAISGDTLLAGADHVDGAAGAAFIFERNHGGAGEWGLVKQIQASDKEAGDNFGLRVDLKGDVAVVSSWKDTWINDDDACVSDARGCNSGSAYTFHRNHGGANQWGQTHKLTASDSTGGEHLGRSAKISGGVITLAATGIDTFPGLLPGSVYVYEISTLESADFDSTGDVDASDIDLLTAAIRSDPFDSIFDLDDSGIADLGDTAFLVETLLGTNFGDRDLDGTVTMSGDGAVLLANLGGVQGDKGWSDGDFTGDENVTASSDGAILLSNLVSDAAAVPEPSGLHLITIVLLLFAVYLCRDKLNVVQLAVPSARRLVSCGSLPNKSVSKWFSNAVRTIDVHHRR